jgi:hypothetical protein
MNRRELSLFLCIFTLFGARAAERVRCCVAELRAIVREFWEVKP